MIASRRLTGLWRHPGFLLLWGGQTISQLGSQVTLWALPLTAVFALRATPGQMGLLAAAGTAPYLLVGLGAGVWVDRVRRRPLMIAADVGRALLLGSIPLAAVLGLLSMAHLYVVAFAGGILRVLFDVAYQSFLPSLVDRNYLIEGNSKLEASNAAAGVIGPGLAGGLVQLFTGPIAILADALSFLVSALSLALIRAREPVPAAQRAHLHLRQEIGEGLRAVLRHPVVRTLAVASALFSLFDSILLAVYVLYLTRTLGVAPVLVGLIFALGGVGGLLGALLAGRVTRAVGVGSAIVGGLLVAGVDELMIALAGGPWPLAVGMVIVGEASVQAGDVLYSINAVSLRQAIVPNQLRGRVNATVRVISAGAAPLGALFGGLVLGQLYGLRTTVLIAGSGTLLASLWLLASPVRRLHIPPSDPHDGALAS